MQCIHLFFSCDPPRREQMTKSLSSAPCLWVSCLRPGTPSGQEPQRHRVSYRPVQFLAHPALMQVNSVKRHRPGLVMCLSRFAMIKFAAIYLVGMKYANRNGAVGSSCVATTQQSAKDQTAGVTGIPRLAQPLLHTLPRRSAPEQWRAWGPLGHLHL